jgi:WS/DGAT/MGAT family acyltransferase
MIEGLEGDRFALYLKIHHAVIDGTSGIAAFMRAFSSDPGDRDTPALWEAGDGTDSAPDPRPRRRRQSVTAARALARDIAEAGRVAADLRRTASYGGPLMAPYQTAVCDLRCTVLGQRRLTTQRLDLPAAKAVAKACGVTLNDVVLYVCATAVRRYLHRHGTLPDRPLTAGVPVNLRDASDRTMGTKIGMMVVDLATNVAGDRERLAAIARSTAAAKHHQQSLPRAVRDNYTTLMHLPYVAALAAGLRGRAPAPFNMVVSNTPGPPTPLYMNGSRMDALYPISLLMHGNALNFTCVSYAGEFNFGIIGGRDEVRHLQDLALYLQQAFRELSDSALAPSRAA